MRLIAHIGFFQSAADKTVVGWCRIYRRRQAESPGDADRRQRPRAIPRPPRQSAIPYIFPYRDPFNVSTRGRPSCGPNCSNNLACAKISSWTSTGNWSHSASDSSARSTFQAMCNYGVYTIWCQGHVISYRSRRAASAPESAGSETSTFTRLTPAPNLRPFVSHARAEQNLLRRSSPNVST